MFFKSFNLAPASSLHCAPFLTSKIFLFARFAPLCRSFWLTPVPVVPLLPSSLFFWLTFVNIDGSSGKYILLYILPHAHTISENTVNDRIRWKKLFDLLYYWCLVIVCERINVSCVIHLVSVWLYTCFFNKHRVFQAEAQICLFAINFSNLRFTAYPNFFHESSLKIYLSILIKYIQKRKFHDLIQAWGNVVGIGYQNEKKMKFVPSRLLISLN